MTHASKPPHPSTKNILGIAVLLGLIAGMGVAYWYYTDGADNSQTNDKAQQCILEKDTAISDLFHGQIAALQFPPQGIYHGGLQFNDATGQIRKLDDFSGKILLVNIWATWCKPCREEMPAISRLQKALGNENFSIIAVSIDRGGKEKPQQFLQQIGVDNLDFFHDPSSGIFNILKAKGRAVGLPVTLLIDKKGCEIAAMNGPAEWDAEEAKALIKVLIDRNF